MIAQNCSSCSQTYASPSSSSARLESHAVLGMQSVFSCHRSSCCYSSCSFAELLNHLLELPVDLLLPSSLIDSMHDLESSLNVPNSVSSRTPAVKTDVQDAASTDQPSQTQCGQSTG